MVPFTGKRFSTENFMIRSYDKTEYSYCELCKHGKFETVCTRCCYAYRSQFEERTFTDDDEKMHDFWQMDKNDFLKSYAYITEEEYDATINELKQKLSLREERKEEI